MPVNINGTTGLSGVDGSAGTPAIQGSDSNTGFSFDTDVVLCSTGGSERWRVDSSGRLLVGTSTGKNVGLGAQALIQVKADANNLKRGIAIYDDAEVPSMYLGRGSSTVASGDTVGLIGFAGHDGTDLETPAAFIYAQVDGTPGADDMPGRLVFSTTADGASSPTERMRLDNIGRFYVQDVYASTNAGAANVVVLSDGRILRSTSSAKYKTGIETLEDIYADNLLKCRPVWYRSTCESDNPNYSYWGFIAEEVAAIDPRLVHWKTFQVTYDENGSAVKSPCDPEPEGVQYDRFVPHLLNLIKRQKEQIEALEARLTAAGI